MARTTDRYMLAYCRLPTGNILSKNRNLEPFGCIFSKQYFHILYFPPLCTSLALAPGSLSQLRKQNFAGGHQILIWWRSTLGIGFLDDVAGWFLPRTFEIFVSPQTSSFLYLLVISSLESHHGATQFHPALSVVALPSQTKSLQRIIHNHDLLCGPS